MTEINESTVHGIDVESIQTIVVLEIWSGFLLRYAHVR
jgi:hypothetical protein